MQKPEEVDNKSYSRAGWLTMSYVVLREQDVSSSATTLATGDVVIIPLLLVVRKVGGKDIRILFNC